MKNQEICYQTLRRQTEIHLASMPSEARVDYLVKKHKRCIKLANQYRLNIHTISEHIVDKEGEEE